jgi:glycosyltransferase involved in cell wall biosynthesis
MKKVLIISYYWPPSGGISVLRSLKIAKHLRQFGWEPIIFTPENADYSAIDHNNFKDIPEGIEILKIPTIEPFKLFKALTGLKKEANLNNVLSAHDKKMGMMYKFSVWVRSNFFIPDARAMWIKPSVRFLTKYAKENKIDAIFTDGPPHTNTRIATLLKKKTNIPWLSDYQDPWSQVDYFQELILTKWGLNRHLKQEQEAFKYADKTTIVSPTWKKDLEGIGAKNVDVIYWGYDPEDYTDISLNKKIESKFSILHAGVMGFDRNPKMFFQAINELCKEEEGFRNDFKLVLLGQVDHSVKNTIEEYGISDLVEFTGNVIRKEALNQIFSAKILLLLLNQQPNAMGRVPGKLFEYLAAKRPILNFGPNNSDVAKLLTKANAGVNFEYDNLVEIKKYLLTQYKAYKEGSLSIGVDSDIEEYTHQNLTNRIANYLNEIVK